MLQNLTGNVERKIRGVNNTLYEIKIVVHKLVALLHNHHPVAVKGDAVLLLAEHIHAVGLSGHKQHCFVRNLPLCVDAGKRTGILGSVVLFLIEADALVIRHFTFASLPDGDHAVDGFVFGDHLIVILRASVLIFLARLKTLLMLDIHTDRPAHIVGILFDQCFDLPYF